MKPETLQDKICNQVGDIFNSHLLNENNMARDMFLKAIWALFEEEKRIAKIQGHSEAIQKIRSLPFWQRLKMLSFTK